MVLGYFGNFGPAQDIPALLETFAQLEGENLRLLLAGNGAQRAQVESLFSMLRDDRITLLDPLPKSEVRNYWGICDIALVHLANSDVFKSVIPSKIFEIFSCGLPIILSAPRGEASQFVESTGVGVAVQSGDSRELATCY